jgi:hypothetical protein
MAVAAAPSGDDLDSEEHLGARLNPFLVTLQLRGGFLSERNRRHAFFSPQLAKRFSAPDRWGFL